jgi:hypothetical protein
MYKNRYVRRAVAEVAGLDIEQIFLAPPVSDGAGFTLALPPGVTWTEEQSQPGDEQGNPVAPLVVNLPVWTWYQAEYPELANREQPTPEEVAAWAPEPDPEPAPLTDVEKYKEVFVGARKNATLLIDTIKATVQDALVKSGAYSASEATIQGVDFVFYHGHNIANYKEAGGHPSAASRLLAAFNSAESAALFPWVKSVEAIFEQALTY